MKRPHPYTAAVIGYLLGTLPSADIAARWATGGRTDIRRAGSGNPGAANALKVLGAKWGAAVMVTDVAKGAAAARLGGRLAGDTGMHVAGTAAVIGHCFPVWSGFRGGKGVAASAGQCAATFPAFFPLDLTLAAASSVGRFRQRAFAATVVASLAWVVAGVTWWRKGWPNLWGPKPTAALPVAAAASSAVIVYRFAAAAVPPTAKH